MVEHRGMDVQGARVIYRARQVDRVFIWCYNDWSGVRESNPHNDFRRIMSYPLNERQLTILGHPSRTPVRPLALLKVLIHSLRCLNMVGQVGIEPTLNRL